MKSKKHKVAVSSSFDGEKEISWKKIYIYMQKSEEERERYREAETAFTFYLQQHLR